MTRVWRQQIVCTAPAGCCCSEGARRHQTGRLAGREQTLERDLVVAVEHRVDDRVHGRVAVAQPGDEHLDVRVHVAAGAELHHHVHAANGGLVGC